MTEKRRIDDPGVLKALAHPLRQRLYGLLLRLGPQPVTALAKRLDTDPGLVSYHLRELARGGFAEEAPELARDRRERWYRASDDGNSWSSADFRTPEARAVATTVQAQMVADQFERLRAYQQIGDSWGDGWAEAATNTNAYLRLTPDELRALSADLLEVLARYKKLAPKPADDGREHVFLFFHAFPEKP
jgi:DNA-binding transcriptional ArsR family regulator